MVPYPESAIQGDLTCDVIAWLDPAIQGLLLGACRSWMPGLRPGPDED